MIGNVSHAAIMASSRGGEVAPNFAPRYTAYVTCLVLVGPPATGFPYSVHFLIRERANSQSDKPRELMDASVRDPFLIVPGHDDARKRLALVMAIPGAAKFLTSHRSTPTHPLL
jgi:pimeloyl-ACP methyl ester carboxylesterase